MKPLATSLTPHGRRYLLDAARGYTVAQTASRHHVSVNTVQSVLKYARKILGARTIAHAVALAMAIGEFNGFDLNEGD